MLKHRILSAIHAFKDNTDCREYMHIPIQYSITKVNIECFSAEMFIPSDCLVDYAKEKLCQKFIGAFKPHIKYEISQENDIPFKKKVRARLNVGFVDDKETDEYE